MNRMEFGLDASLKQRAPAGAYPCALHALASDGQAYEAEVPCPPGFSRGGLAAADVVAKFNAITADRLSAAARETIVETVLDLDRVGSCAKLFESLRAPFVN